MTLHRINDRQCDTWLARTMATVAIALAASPCAAQFLDGFAPLVDGGPVHTLAIQNDGAIVLGGGFTSVDGVPRNGIARVLPDGTLDAGYAPFNGAGATEVWRVLLQPDGKLLLTYGLFVARLDPDGSFDESWGGNDLCLAPEFSLQSDGKVLAPGGCFDPDNPPELLDRLMPDGTADTSFSTDARTYQSSVADSATQSNGKIVVIGTFDNIGDTTRHGIARLEANGSLDDDFDPDADGPVYALRLLPNDDILVGGDFGEIGGQPRGSFARLDRDGHVIAGFAPNINGTVYAIATDANGILLAGDFSSIDGTPRSNLARLRWDGSLDPSFDPDVIGIAQALVVQSDSKIVIGGYITFVGNHPREHLARVNPDGSVDDSFGAGTDGPVQALAAWADNSLVIGGAYTRIESTQGAQTAAPGLAWIKADGDDPVPDFAPQEICAVPFCGVNGIALQPDDRKIVLGHSFFTVGGIDGAPDAPADPNDALPVMRLFPNGLIDPSFDLNAQAWLSGNVYAVLRQPDGQLLVAGCLTAGGTPNVMVARLNTDGTQDFSFSPLLNNGDDCSLPSNNYAALALALLPDGRIVVGGEFYYFVDPLAQAPNLALLRTNGLPDRPVYADGPVFALASQPDGRVLIGGAFSAVNDTSPAYIARMNPDTSIDGSFNAAVNGVVRAVGVRADGKIFIGGDFTVADGVARTYLALLGGQGEAQQNFHHDIDAPVQAIAVQSDGKVAFGGQFTTVDGLPHAHVARVSVPDPARYAIDYVVRPPLAPWVYWTPQGAGAASGATPELSYSLDGVTYTDVGAMSFDPNAQRWTFGSFRPPLDRLVFLRVREAASGGSLETVLPVFDADEIFRDGFD